MVFSRAALHDAERFWAWKLALRAITIVAALVAVGCVAWTVSQNYDNGDFWLLPWDLIPLGVSVIWNLSNIIVLFVRKRPVHPGANVGLDLVLWLTFGVTSSFLLFAAIDQLSWTYSDLVFDQYNEPTYMQFPNGTYGYELGHFATVPNGSEIFVPDNSTGVIPCDAYASCAQEEYITNQFHDLAVVKTIAFAFSLLVLLLHFTLFVWACIDTHARNKGKTDARATRIAQSIVAEMANRGVIPAPQQRQQEEALLGHEVNAEQETTRMPLTERDQMILGHISGPQQAQDQMSGAAGRYEISSAPRDNAV